MLARWTAPIAAVLALGALGVGTAGAEPSDQAEAVRAVKEEIGSRWLLLETVPESVRRPGARASVRCEQASRGRFLCSWTARNRLHDQIARGSAIVTPRPRGAEARLFAELCVAREALPCV